MSGANYDSLKRASTAIEASKANFEDCGFQELYFNARKMVLAKMVRKLENRSFAMTELNGVLSFEDDDEDINF